MKKLRLEAKSPKITHQELEEQDLSPESQMLPLAVFPLSTVWWLWGHAGQLFCWGGLSSLTFPTVVPLDSPLASPGLQPASDRALRVYYCSPVPARLRSPLTDVFDLRTYHGPGKPSLGLPCGLEVVHTQPSFLHTCQSCLMVWGYSLPPPAPSSSSFTSSPHNKSHTSLI